LSERRRRIDAEIRELKRRRVEDGRKLEDLRNTRRFAPAKRFNDLTERIEQLEEVHTEALEHIRELEDEKKETITPHLDVCARVVATRDGLKALRARASEEPVDPAALRTDLRSRIASFASIDASMRRFFIGDINWGIWITPLLAWGLVILLTYAVLMSFNVLMFRQWAHNEKIIYPLAQLPTALAERPEGSAQVVPPIFKRGLFWTGFAISTTVLTWNYLIEQRLIPGMGEIPLDIRLGEYLRGSFLEGIQQSRFNIFFTLIGLTFLVPARISFSIWFFHLFFMVELLLLVWLGYGVDIRSFPQDPNLVLNFRFAQGGGALIVFAILVLYRCRTYVFCSLFPRRLEPMEDAERKELQVSSAVFMICSVALILAMTVLLGANLFYSVFFYLITLVVTIGLTRAVTEGGILSLQAHCNPFHLIRSFFGMDKGWTSPALYAPLWVFHALLFFDLKTFIAPMMANSLKIRDNLKLHRARFHIAAAVAILCAMVIAVVTHIILAYDRGGDAMNSWFYSGLLRWLTFGTLKTMTSTNPVDAVHSAWWLVSGAAIMVSILLLRRRVFWMIHPIGLIMFVNPLMRWYWASVMLGWLFKSLVSKYGNKDTYERLRTLFIGLILGELAICMLGWATLNRH
jgi:hypothetical protein